MRLAIRFVAIGGKRNVARTRVSTAAVARTAAAHTATPEAMWRAVLAVWPDATLAEVQANFRRKALPRFHEKGGSVEELSWREKRRERPEAD